MFIPKRVPKSLSFGDAVDFSHKNSVISLDSSSLFNVFEVDYNLANAIMSYYESISSNIFITGTVHIEWRDLIKTKYENLIQKRKQDFFKTIVTPRKLSYGHDKAVQKFYEDCLKAAEAVSSQSEYELHGLRKRIDSLVQKCLGSPLNNELREEVLRIAPNRFSQKVPPGYEDAMKTDERRRYNDLLIWFELMEHAKSVKRTICFVTNDLKEDWWHEENNVLISARNELKKEMFEQSGQRFILVHVGNCMKEHRNGLLYRKHLYSYYLFDKKQYKILGEFNENYEKIFAISDNILGVRSKEMQGLFTCVDGLNNRFTSNFTEAQKALQGFKERYGFSPFSDEIFGGKSNGMQDFLAGIGGAGSISALIPSSEARKSLAHLNLSYGLSDDLLGGKAKEMQGIFAGIGGAGSISALIPSSEARKALAHLNLSYGLSDDILGGKAKDMQGIFAGIGGAGSISALIPSSEARKALAHLNLSYGLSDDILGGKAKEMQGIFAGIGGAGSISALIPSSEAQKALAHLNLGYGLSDDILGGKAKSMRDFLTYFTEMQDFSEQNMPSNPSRRALASKKRRETQAKRRARRLLKKKIH